MEEDYIKHDGKHWRIYYYPIDSFEDDLPAFGEFLESLETKGEKVSAIVPNMGWVKASWLLEGFQGVKGFAIVARKTENQ